MLGTLVVYDGKMGSPERIAQMLASIIGHAKAVEIGEAPHDLTPYGGFCFVFSYYGLVTAEKTVSWMTAKREMLKGKRGVMVGIGPSDAGFALMVSDAEARAAMPGTAGIFIKNESETERAGIEISRIMGAPDKEMPWQECSEAIDDFIGTDGIMILAAARSGRPSAIPVRYRYDGGVFYLLSEGGPDMSGIMKGEYVSAVMCDDISGKGQMRELQTDFAPELIPEGSDEYSKVLWLFGESGDGPFTRYAIRLLPLRFVYTDPGHEAGGYDLSQTIETRYLSMIKERGERYAAETGRAMETNEEAAERLRKKLLAAGGAAEVESSEQPEDAASGSGSEAAGVDEYEEQDAEDAAPATGSNEETDPGFVLNGPYEEAPRTDHASVMPPFMRAYVEEKNIKPGDSYRFGSGYLERTYSFDENYRDGGVSFYGTGGSLSELEEEQDDEDSPVLVEKKRAPVKPKEQVKKAEKRAEKKPVRRGNLFASLGSRMTRALMIDDGEDAD